MAGTRATIEAHPFFSNTTLNLGAQDLFHKNWFREKKTATSVYHWIMKNPNGLPTQTRIIAKKKCRFSDDFGLMNPRDSETIFARKRYTLILFPTIFGQEAPSFRKRFRQKEVYLNAISDYFGSRSPVSQKTFSPKNSIP